MFQAVDGVHGIPYEPCDVLYFQRTAAATITNAFQPLQDLDYKKANENVQFSYTFFAVVVCLNSD